jgi:hypothetical protein
MSLSDDFLQDPFTYCRQKSAGGKGRILIVNPLQTVHLTAKGAYGYSSVNKAERVSYCRIAQNVIIGQMTNVKIATGAEAVVAEVQNNPPNPGDFGKKVGEWFPCFFLPWTANQTFRITLKHPGGFVDEPRIFVTSTLDGCSVIVEGSLDTPTVYHLNDAGGGGNPPASTNLATQQGYWTPKGTTMETTFQGAKSPKTVKAQAANPLLPALPGAKAVHALDYMDVTEAQYPARDTDLDHFGYKQMARDKVPGATAVKYIDSSYKPYGTVFGWKQNATWRFFYQQRAVIFYRYSVTDRGGTSKFILVARQLGFNCDEFWPNGSGIAVGKVVVP